MEEIQPPGKLTEQIEYENAYKQVRDAAIKLRLRRQFGLDPYKISRQRFDQIQRLFEKIEKSENEMNNKINVLRMEQQKEANEIFKEINTIASEIHQDQNPPASDKSSHEEPSKTEEVNKSTDIKSPEEGNTIG